MRITTYEIKFQKYENYTHKQSNKLNLVKENNIFTENIVILHIAENQKSLYDC